MFVSGAMEHFFEHAEAKLDAATLEELSQKYLAVVWKFARYEDESVFGSDWTKTPRVVPSVLGAADQTAINYMSRVDRMYVSKWVSGDPATSAQIEDFLRSQYLETGLGRGKSPKELAAFRSEFSDLVETVGEHRTRVIIDTGVSRCQNWGEILALSDMNITQFRIAGPWDRLTCKWCLAMQGKVFEVQTERTRIEEIIASGDEDISKFGKFITSRFAGQEGVKALADMPAADVQATGMVTAPIHPLCRHRVVAVVKLGTGNVWALPEREPISLVEWMQAA
jgi:hypothetical protein